MCQECGSRSHPNATRGKVIKDTVMGAAGWEALFFLLVLQLTSKHARSS